MELISVFFSLGPFLVCCPGGNLNEAFANQQVLYLRWPIPQQLSALTLSGSYRGLGSCITLESYVRRDNWRWQGKSCRGH